MAPSKPKPDADRLVRAARGAVWLMDLPLADPMPYEKALEAARGVPMDIGMVPPPHPGRPTNWIRALVRPAASWTCSNCQDSTIA